MRYDTIRAHFKSRLTPERTYLGIDGRGDELLAISKITLAYLRACANVSSTSLSP